MFRFRNHTNIINVCMYVNFFGTLIIMKLCTHILGNIRKDIGDFYVEINI